MAFGRDGSEWEMQILDLRNRALARALEKIIDASGEDKIVRMAKKALADAEKIGAE